MPYDQDSEDALLKKLGATPASREKHLTEAELREALREKAESHKCRWEQHGTMLVCVSGDLEHGRPIPPGMRLKNPGTDDPSLEKLGPILRDSQESA